MDDRIVPATAGRVALLISATLLAVLTVVQLLGPPPADGLGGLVWSLGYDLVFLVSAVACLQRGRRIPGERRAWTLIGTGLLLSGLGFTYDSTAFLLHVEAVFPGPADVLYMALYPFVYFGVLGLVRERTGHGSSVATDGALAALTLVAVAGVVVIPPLSAGGGDPATIMTNVVYPLADLHLLFFVMWTGVVGGRRLGLAWPILAAVLVLAVAVDAIYLVEITAGTYAGGLLDLGWAAVALGYAATAFVPRGRSVALPVRDHRRLRVATPVVAAVVCIGLVINDALHEDPELLLVAATMLAAIARAVRVAAGARRLEVAVESSEAQLAEAQRLAKVGSFEFATTTDGVEWSDEMWRIHGLPRTALSPADALSMIHADDRAATHAAIAGCVAGEGDFTAGYRITRPGGELRHLEMRGTLRGTVMRASVQDVTERVELEDGLRWIAEHDSLTGLPNRSRFEAALQAQSLAGGRFAVSLLDLDHIKLVNDSFGHAAGDELICHAAAKMRAVLRPEDLLGRFGGDQFVLLLPGAGKEDAVRIVERVLQAMRDDPWRDAQRQTASAGIALAVADQVRGADDMLKAADLALYQAKNAGRDRCVIYRGPDGGLAWVDEVRAAIAQERLVLHSQKIVPLHGGPEREELLVRMLDRDGELLPPSAFIPVAEQFGLISDLDLWVVRQAVELARAGRAVEVNLSGASLGEEAIVACVRDAVESGVDPDLLVFEVTETAAVRNLDHARYFAEQLTGLGCGFALDDFGTGFGSLTYLRHLPVTQIKIDIEFVRDLVTDPGSRKIVRAIVGIAESFGHETVAEGVEDLAAVGLLRDMGVDFAQGYALHRPAPVHAVRERVMA